jgi:hypothetical protein
MCNRHLLGEHGELHKFLPSWIRKHGITGRIFPTIQIEPLSYLLRHNVLVEEMERRGMHHQSPIYQPDFSYLPEDHLNARVDVENSLKDLRERCPECAKLQNEFL